MRDETPQLKQSLSFVAYEKIKAMILDMELAPGSSLTEMGLIEKLSMSRTPIREALYRLQQERFVELAPRKGWFVSQIRLRDIQELFEIREALEGISARNATHRIPQEKLQAMATFLDSLEQALIGAKPFSTRPPHCAVVLASVMLEPVSSSFSLARDVKRIGLEAVPTASIREPRETTI